MDFDAFTVVLLVTAGAEMTPELQDAHLAHLAGLHDDGVLMAAGPLTHAHGDYRGLSILRCDADEARRVSEADPAVQAGVFALVVLPWTVPAGAVHGDASAFFPRSVADVLGGDQPS